MKTAVVVGGGRSLGAFLSKHLAAEGFRVAVLDINAENACAVAQEIVSAGGEAKGYYVNACQEDSVTEVFAQVSADLGAVYLMLYVAGIARSAKITEFTLKDFTCSVDVNLTGYFLCARAAARIMIDNGIKGRIIQINSKSGCVGSKYIPGDATAQAVMVEEAHAQNIPVIELCTKTEAEDYRTSFVGSDDIVAGRMLMEYLGDLVDGKGDMIIFHGPTGVSAEINRHTGAQQMIKEKNWDIKVVAEKVCNWSREEAMTAMENIITSGIKFDIIFAENDEMAVGALSALKDSGLKYVIGGIDAIPDAVQAVADGDMDCTFFQDYITQAKTALDVAIKAASGEQVDASYDIDFVLITKENVADFQ